MAGWEQASVSIVIPVRNRPRLVCDAIDSALRQNLDDFHVEVIVVDDASTDDTPMVLQRYGTRIRLARLDAQEGQCRARNEGLHLAGETYVKFLDSDDILCDGVLAEEVALADREAADIVISGWVEEWLDENDSVTTHEVDPPLMEPMPDALLAGHAVPTSAALYRRDAVAHLEWDPDVSKLDDWDWFCMAALEARKIASIRRVSYRMRAHEGERLTRSSTMLANALSHHRVLRKIERRLSEHGLLTEERRKRLAQYYYKEMRVLSLYDRDAFERGVIKILELDAAFQPIDEERQAWMRWLSRMAGFRRAILLHSALKKAMWSGLDLVDAVSGKRERWR